jgi:hypothetical protein
MPSLQARTGDTVLVKSRELTDRTHKLPWLLGVEGVKTTENKIDWPPMVSMVDNPYLLDEYQQDKNKWHDSTKSFIKIIEKV